ncbi:MAG: hypothetical protein ACLSVD_09375 [Eggerthellaceae bacterium]
MSCSAKLPIYAFFTAAFFPANGAAVMVGCTSAASRWCAGGAAHAVDDVLGRGGAVRHGAELPRPARATWRRCCGRRRRTSWSGRSPSSSWQRSSSGSCRRSTSG